MHFNHRKDYEVEYTKDELDKVSEASHKHRLKIQNERRQKQTALKTTNYVSVNVINES